MKHVLYVRQGQISAIFIGSACIGETVETQRPNEVPDPGPPSPTGLAPPVPLGSALGGPGRNRQGGTGGRVAAGSTPSAGPGAGCGEGGKRPKGLALVSSALPYPPRRSRKDIRLRYWARKGGWGGAHERSAVLESFFPAPQSRTVRGPSMRADSGRCSESQRRAPPSQVRGSAERPARAPPGHTKAPPHPSRPRDRRGDPS